jgi:hypothetical protein
MNSRTLNFLLIVTSLIGYLEWGGKSHTFLFQAEIEVISKLLTDPVSAVHPLTVLPLIGQILLFITLFQKKPGKILTYAGIGSLGVLLGLMFVIGAISLNYKIAVSTIPFILVAVLTVWHYRKSSQPV